MNKMPCHITDGPDEDDWNESNQWTDDSEPSDFELYREAEIRERERDRKEFNDLAIEIGRLV